ncbi:MAG: hypothetical protein AAGA72_04890 [Pseudomonadota bacterium]
MTGAPAAAQCDISQTKCAINNGKCNIQFKNRTSDTGGSDGSSNIDQSSSAQTIVVKARKANGDKAGNKLQIVAGAKKTMNIEKKSIRISRKSKFRLKISTSSNRSLCPVQMFKTY